MKATGDDSIYTVSFTAHQQIFAICPLREHVSCSLVCENNSLVFVFRILWLRVLRITLRWWEETLRAEEGWVLPCYRQPLILHLFKLKSLFQDISLNSGTLLHNLGFSQVLWILEFTGVLPRTLKEPEKKTLKTNEMVLNSCEWMTIIQKRTTPKKKKTPETSVDL